MADHISRAEMEDVILNKKGSVLYQGRLINDVSQLPTHAELAQNAEQLDKADADIDSQMELLKAQKKSIAARKGEIKKENAKADEKPANDNASVGPQQVDMGAGNIGPNKK